MSDLTSEFLSALIRAPADSKVAALRVLRGETPERGLPRSKAPEPYVGLKDVAAFLGVSARSVWRWGVPGHKLGSRTRFRLSEVAAYTESEAFQRRMEELKRTRNAEG